MSNLRKINPFHPALLLIELGVLIAIRVFYILKRKERLPMGSKVESINGQRVIRWPGRMKRTQRPPAAQIPVSKLERNQKEP